MASTAHRGSSLRRARSLLPTELVRSSFPAFALGSNTDDTFVQVCRIGLQRCGPAQVFIDNLAAAELLWAEADVAGRVPDWRELLHKEGKLVAFF